tara:strand:+ start:2490 stop:3779 length:1290 start_codon:yes stop_codon:yes gene_type:complete
MIPSLGKINKTNPDIFAREGCLHFQMGYRNSVPKIKNIQDLHILFYKDRNETCAAIGETKPELSQLPTSIESFFKIADNSGLTSFYLGKPLPLEPVTIEKPWGKEIWFSAIEERGVSKAGGVPINFLVDIFGDQMGCSHPPILLKILAPNPQPGLGELYFELHEKKTEVYIVTEVNKTSWPEGKGGIRMGFDKAKISEFESQEKFLEEYSSSVESYRECRNIIDSKIDEIKNTMGFGKDQILNPTAYQALLSKLDQSLIQKEKTLREQMNEYTKLHEIGIGDSIKVKPLVPHSLQHGVRVVEFQTPHYERYILSFGQKVVTQDHWDTREGLKKAKIQSVEIEEPKRIDKYQDILAEFDEFKVVRISLPAGGSYEIKPDSYCLIMGISGTTEFKGYSICTEDAFFVPTDNLLTFTNSGDRESCFLIAEES